MTRIGITMPLLLPPLDRIEAYAKLADSAGLHSLWIYQFYRDPFVMLAAAAAVTDHIRLATGIAVSSSRSPFAMANAAADVDELSHGRAVAGIGLGLPEFLPAFHSMDVHRPLAHMREYIDVMRATWAYLANPDEPIAYDGDIFRLRPPPFLPYGGRVLARPTIPIHLAAVGPRMQRLAGEKADGVIGFLQTPAFIDGNVLPNVRVGAQRAGRDPGEIDIVSLVICSVSRDRAEAVRRARLHVGMYVAHPLANAMVRHHGLDKDQAAVVEALTTGGPETLEKATSDALVETFSIAGTPDEVRRKAAAYENIHLVLHTPYTPPLTVEESEDCYRNSIETFGGQ